jgi:hypothetical protein
MKITTVFCIILMSLVGCTDTTYPAVNLVDQNKPSYPEYDSTGQVFNLDSLLDHLEDQSSDLHEGFPDAFPEEVPSFVEMEPIEDDGVDYWGGKTVTNTEVRGVTLTPVKDTIAVLDTLNQILGVTELSFVWKGDTCTTNSMNAFLATYDIEEGLYYADIKPVFLKTVMQHFLMASPTEAVIAGDLYLKSVMLGVGLDEYVRFNKWFTKKGQHNDEEPHN